MIKSTIAAIACLATLLLASPSSAQDPVEAVSGLIRRVVPEHAEAFTVDLSLQPVDGKDAFEVLGGEDGNIILRGNNGVSVASALHWYLKNKCNAHISWNGSQLDLPDPLPTMGEKVAITNLHQYRVYLNYCTINYTASWWDWERWQREIDFMAMNGINMPLGVVGLEGAWYHTLLKHNFTDLEARSFLTHPTHLAWQWMTNLQGDDNEAPLPKEWIDQQVALGKKMLDYQRTLGMTPIQQGFTGCVPRLLAEKYPEASIVQEKSWLGYEGTAQLDPLDPLFKKFGESFLETQKELFGTSHFYAADPFHEGHPPRPGKEYLRKVGTEIHKLIKGFDPKGTVAMQSWSIKQEICESFPKEDLLVLDLAGRKEDFWGYSFVKGQLHNFGGRTNLHGDLRSVAINSFAEVATRNPLCVGMGLFMEGIEHNPVFYNMSFDMVWRDESVDPHEWLKNYATRRYGKPSESATAAWNILIDAPYSPGTNAVEFSSIIAARPALKPHKSGPNTGFNIPYEPTDLIRAWELLLEDHEALRDSEGYQFDIADVGRQVLSNLGQEIIKDIRIAFFTRDREAFDKATGQFLELLNDVDTLLSPVSTYHLGKWVTDARSLSEDPATQDYYQQSAMQLLSIWGPNTEAIQIWDYAWREWSGLIKHYYLPRWEKFFEYLDPKLENNEPYQDAPPTRFKREQFRGNEFLDQLADWELNWRDTQPELDPVSVENPVDIGTKLLAKYQPLFLEMYDEERPAKLEAAEKVVESNLFDELVKEKGHPFFQWTPRKLGGTDWKEFTIDVTEFLDDTGDYIVQFFFEDGLRRLEIASVELLQNDVVISKDEHTGFAGPVLKNNVYSLKLDDFAFNTPYQVRIKARSNKDHESFGTARIKKQ